MSCWISEYLCLGYFDQYSNWGAEWTTEKPKSVALQSVPRLVLCLTFPAALLTTARSCHCVKKKTVCSCIWPLTLVENKVSDCEYIYFYIFPYALVLLCWTEHKDFTFTWRTGIFYYAGTLHFLYRMYYEIGGWLSKLTSSGRKKRQIVRVIVCQLFIFNDKINSLLIITGT